MRKVLILLLLVSFLVPVLGCASKTEYDKLLDQKAAAEKRLEDANAQQEDLRKTISTREMEIKDLKNQLQNSQRELAKSKAEVAKLTQELSGLKSK